MSVEKRAVSAVFTSIPLTFTHSTCDLAGELITTAALLNVMVSLDKMDIESRQFPISTRLSVIVCCEPSIRYT